MQSFDGFALTPPPGTVPSAQARSDGKPQESPEQIYQRVYRVLKPRSKPVVIRVRFEKFANADSYIRLENGTLLVRMTDLLQDSPALITEALAFILIGKLLRKKVPAIYAHRYSLFLNRRETRQRTHRMRQERGRKLCLEPRGRVHDLDEIFDRLNVEFFDGLMAKPRLGWSLRVSRTRLGHYDPSHDTIVISRIFDAERVHKKALEYVVFHEMLHLRYPVEHRGAKRCIHTAEFKRAERQYPDFEEAQRILARI